MSKTVNLNLIDFIADDDWDAVASAVNNWQGTLTLRYIYEETSSPIPLPSSGLLFLSGLGIMAAWGRRCKRAIFMTVLTLPVVAGMLSSSPAAADTMTWVQTRTFNFADTAALCEWQGSWATARPSSSAHQEDTFSFQGAPQEFLRLGSLYKLANISFQLDSTFTGTYHLYAYDFQWVRSCGATGYSSTSVTAFLDMPPYYSLFGSSALGEPLAQTAYAYGVEVYSGSGRAENFAYPVITIDADLTIEPSLFPTFDKLEIPFKLSKDIRVGLVTWQEDDESDYMTNEVNKWEGTVKLTYTYTEVAPVPAPATLWLFLRGLISMAILRRRVRI